MKESEIVRQICDLLDILQKQGRVYYVRLVNPGIITHEQQPRRGQPDLVGWFSLMDGNWLMPFAWEIKGPKGIVSPGQEAELEVARAAGGQALVIRSLEEAVAALSELGVDVEVI